MTPDRPYDLNSKSSPVLVSSFPSFAGDESPSTSMGVKGATVPSEGSHSWRPPAVSMRHSMNLHQGGGWSSQHMRILVPKPIEGIWSLEPDDPNGRVCR